MASKFINIVSSGNIANGAVAVVPHLLNRDGVALVPDIYAANRSGFTVTVNATNVTFTNNTGAAATCSCYVRYDHSIQRVFGAESTTTLAGFPFDIGGNGTAGAGVTLAQAYANGAAGPQIIPLTVANDGIFILHTAGIQNEAALVVQNATQTVSWLSVRGGATDDLGSVTLRSHVAVSAIAGAGGTGVDDPVLTVTGAANTSVPASTEVEQVHIDLAQIRTWDTGNFALQRTVRIDAETMAFVAASTVTDATTLAISGPPVAGANATITQSWAAWFGGKVFIGDTTPDFNTALAVYNTGDVAVRIRTSSAAGSAQLSIGNDGAALGFLNMYGTGVGTTTFGIADASSLFLQTARPLGIGTTAAQVVALASNGIARAQLGTDAEGAKVTAVYISENTALKRITIGANDSGGAGFSVLRVPN